MVSFRLGMNDGVSIEAQKWTEAFRALGHDVTLIAGEGPVDVVLPGLALAADAPPTSDELRHALADHDVVVVENLASLPLNPRARDVLYEVLQGRDALFHHHDLPWQRAHLAHLEGPRDAPTWRHVTINERSRLELHERGIEADTIYNHFDCDPPAGDRARTRAWLDVSDQKVALVPTRALTRKNIAGALRLAEELGAVFWLLGPAEDGYGDELQRLLAKATTPTRLGLRHDMSVHDAYAACDLVVMASLWEGFGNPTIESITHRRPLALHPYPVSEELRSLGLRFFDLRDVESLRRELERPDEAALAANLEVVRQRLNLADLARVLDAHWRSWGFGGGQ